jgi:hypothetical protein
MGKTTDQIERETRTIRGNLSENLGELLDRIKGAVDWRTQVSERPGTMLALAFGGGIVVSALLPKRSRNRNWPTQRDEAPNSRSAVVASRVSTPSETAETFSALKAALFGAAITKASAFVEELQPGFNEEFSKAKVLNRTCVPVILKGPRSRQFVRSTLSMLAASSSNSKP